MPKKVETKKDPLLENDGSQTPELVKKEKSAETVVKSEVPGVKTPGNSIKQEAVAKFPKDIVKQTKYILDNGEHVNFIVPMAEGEKAGAFETTQINGYKLTIKKGIMVSLPLAVANLIAEKYRINIEAGREKRLDQATAETSAALG